MNVWKTRQYTSDHGGQLTANSKSLVQRQRRTDDQVSWVDNAAQEVGDVRPSTWIITVYKTQWTSTAVQLHASWMFLSPQLQVSATILFVYKGVQWEKEGKELPHGNLWTIWNLGMSSVRPHDPLATGLFCTCLSEEMFFLHFLISKDSVQCTLICQFYWKLIWVFIWRM